MDKQTINTIMLKCCLSRPVVKDQKFAALIDGIVLTFTETTITADLINFEHYVDVYF